MKKTLFSFFVILSLASFGQTYHPLLELGRKWQGLEVHEGTNNPNGDEFLVTLIDTITIDSMLYYKPGPFVFEDHFLFREDTLLKQVYIYNTDLDEEYVVFDFSLELGDTVENLAVSRYFEIMPEDTVDYYVSSIDSVEMVDGSMRKRRFLRSTGPAFQTILEMTEGIGGPRGVFTSAYGFFEHGWMLHCMRDNDIVVYGVCHPFSTEEHNSSSVQIYPTPVSNQLEIEAGTPISINVYNIIGERIYHSADLKLHHHINFSAYQSGVYIVKGIAKDNKAVFVNKVVKSE